MISSPTFARLRETTFPPEKVRNPFQTLRTEEEPAAAWVRIGRKMPAVESLPEALDSGLSMPPTGGVGASF